MIPIYLFYPLFIQSIFRGGIINLRDITNASTRILRNGVRPIHATLFVRLPMINGDHLLRSIRPPNAVSRRLRTNLYMWNPCRTNNCVTHRTRLLLPPNAQYARRQCPRLQLRTLQRPIIPRHPTLINTKRSFTIHLRNGIRTFRTRLFNARLSPIRSILTRAGTLIRHGSSTPSYRFHDTIPHRVRLLPRIRFLLRYYFAPSQCYSGDTVRSYILDYLSQLTSLGDQCTLLSLSTKYYRSDFFDSSTVQTQCSSGVVFISLSQLPTIIRPTNDRHSNVHRLITRRIRDKFLRPLQRPINLRRNHARIPRGLFTILLRPLPSLHFVQYRIRQ